MVVRLRGSGAGRIAKSWPLLSALFGLVVLIAAPQAVLAGEPLIEFDIPAEPLDAALHAFSALTRTQLLFDPDLTEGRHANTLKGTFTPEAALRQLLAGTGLAVRVIDGEGFTLVPELAAEGSHDWNDMSPTVRRFNTYSAAVQSAIHGALCGNKETTPGAYRVLARVWIGPSGVTDRAELLTSSGDVHRDALLATTFRGLSIGSSPPSDLPQPITLLVTSEGVSAGYCAVPQQPDRGREAGR